MLSAEALAGVKAVVEVSVVVVVGVEEPTPTRVQDLRPPQDIQHPQDIKELNILIFLMASGQDASCISDTDEGLTFVQNLQRAPGRTFSLQGLQNEI